MSRKYQGLIVLNPKAIDGTIDETVTAVSKEFEAEGVKIENVSQLGRRQFAYSPRHVEAGHYVNYTFSGAPETVSKIQDRLRLNENIYLQHFQRLS